MEPAFERLSFQKPDACLTSLKDPMTSPKQRLLAVTAFTMLGCAALLVWNGVINTLQDFNQLYDAHMNDTTTATLMTIAVVTNIVWVYFGATNPLLVYLSGAGMVLMCIVVPMVSQWASGQTGVALIHVACALLGICMGTLQPAGFAMASVTQENFCGLVSLGMGLSGLLSFVMWLSIGYGMCPIQDVTDKRDPKQLKAGIWLFFCLMGAICLFAMATFWLAVSRVGWFRDALMKDAESRRDKRLVRRLSHEASRRSTQSGVAGGPGTVRAAQLNADSLQTFATLRLKAEEGMEDMMPEQEDHHCVTVETESLAADNNNNDSSSSSSRPGDNDEATASTTQQHLVAAPHQNSIQDKHMPTQSSSHTRAAVVLADPSQMSVLANIAHYWWVFRQAWAPILALFLVLFISLQMFPNVGPVEWGSNTLVLAGMFQVGDFLGRYIPNSKRFVGRYVLCHKNIVLPLAIARIVFIPLFMACFKFGKASPADRQDAVLGSLAFHVILMLIFAVSNGWLCSACFIYIPERLKESADRQRASTMGMCLMLIAIMLGLWVSKLYLL